MKMRPDRSDYETWIIDYLDGNLDDNQVRQLFSFLQENPDIMEEFNELENHSVKTNRVEFGDKDSLKKTVHQLTDKQFDNLCVAYLENDLTAEQRDEVEEIIRSDAGRDRIFNIINSTKLIPPAVAYPHKKSLYRLTLLRKAERIAVASISIAATILILVTLLVKRPERVPESQYIAVADTLHEPAGINDATDEPELQERILPPVPEKTMESADRITVVAESITSPEPSGDSAKTASYPEVRKAEFRQEVALATFSEPAGLTIASGTNTIVTDYYATEPEVENRSVARFIRDRIRRPEPTEKEKITAFDVADAGINGLNKLFGWEISLEKNRDNDGTVKSLNFNSKLIKVSAPVKKSEPVE